MCTINHNSFHSGENFLENWHSFLQKYRENPRTLLVYTVHVFYESSRNFWTFKYYTILPNKSMNIFINYGLSLIIVVLLAIKGTFNLRGYFVFCVMKVVFCIHFPDNRKKDMYRFTQPAQNYCISHLTSLGTPWSDSPSWGAPGAFWTCTARGLWHPWRLQHIPPANSEVGQSWGSEDPTCDVSPALLALGVVISNREMKMCWK